MSSKESEEEHSRGNKETARRDLHSRDLFRGSLGMLRAAVNDTWQYQHGVHLVALADNTIPGGAYLLHDQADLSGLAFPGDLPKGCLPATVAFDRTTFMNPKYMESPLFSTVAVQSGGALSHELASLELGAIRRGNNHTISEMDESIINISRKESKERHSRENKETACRVLHARECKGNIS